MSFGLFENLDSGAHSLTVTASASRRNHSMVVHQAYKDFGQFLASAESVQDLKDRVRLVEAELREAGVNDPEGVLDGLAALAASDDTDDDSDSSDDDSDGDVPDFVDTDKDDSKDRDDDDKSSKESKVALNETLPTDPNSVNAAPADPSLSAPNPAQTGIPGASAHPVVPRNAQPGIAPGGPVNPNQGLQQGAADAMRAQPNWQAPAGARDPLAGVDPTMPQRTYSKILPVVPRHKK